MNERDIVAVIDKSDELRAASKHDEAIELLSEAIRDTPDARLYFARGTHFDESDQPEDAVTDFTKAIELQPDEARYYLARGRLLACALYRNRDALLDLERYLEFKPENVEAHQRACLCYLLLDLPLDQAWHHANAARQLAPHDHVTHFCVGQAQRSSKRFAEAVESFERAIDLEPEFAHYWAALGNSLRHSDRKEDLASAVAAYSKALQLAPDSQYDYYSRGHVRLQLGELDEAIADLRQARSMNPTEGQLILINHALAEAEKRSK